MDSAKQRLFIERVLFMFGISARKSKTGTRLTLAEWNAECDRMCLAGHILREMSVASDDQGDQLFPDIMDAVRTRTIEGYL